jgi:hypothetical protein
MRAEAVRASKFTTCLCVLMTGACGPPESPTQQATLAPVQAAPEVESEMLLDSENPRCLQQGQVNGEITCKEYRVSIVELLANPAQWHGKNVVVIGFAAVSFEHSAIYLHRQDMEAGIMSNGLWLELPSGFAPSGLEKGEYVLVRGKFDAKAGGHLDGFNGTIRASHVRSWGP